MAETGHKGVDIGVWYGVIAPVGTPRGIIDSLNRETNTFFSGKPIRDRLIAGGAQPVGDMSPE